MAASNVPRSTAVMVENKPKFYVESDESYSGSGGGGSPAANGPSNSTFVGIDRGIKDVSGNNGHNNDRCSSLTPRESGRAPHLPTESPIIPCASTSMSNNCLPSVPPYHQPMPGLNPACGIGSGLSRPSSGNLVHSVLRSSRDGHKCSLIYWDHINEILDTASWLRLKKMATDTKNNADLLLSDNRCLSISFQALSELMTLFGLLVLDERRTNFLVVSQPATPAKDKQKVATEAVSAVAQQECTAPVSSLAEQHKPGVTQQKKMNKQPKLTSGTNDPGRNLVDQHEAHNKPLVAETRIVISEDEHISDPVGEAGGELSIERKSQIISQLLLVYDLLQKIQQVKIFNGSRSPIKCYPQSSKTSYPTLSTGISPANDPNVDTASSFTYHNANEQTSCGGTRSKVSNTLTGTGTDSATVVTTSASCTAGTLPTQSSYVQRTVANTYVKAYHNQPQCSGSTNAFVDPSSSDFPSAATSDPDRQEQRTFACPIINVQCLRNLESLTLDKVPVEAVKGLQSHRARQLQCLTLRRAGITKISEISVSCGADKAAEHSWQFLMEADFSHNPMKSLDSSLRLFTNLTALQLIHCDLESANGLALLTAPLQHLDLSYNNLTTLPTLNPACHETLLSLRLVFNSICSIMGMQQLVAMQHLELQDNLLTLAGSLAPLGALADLRTLWIMGNPVCSLDDARTHIISRLHSKLARNKFHLDETRLSDYDLTKLSTRNWVLGRSGALDLSIHEEEDPDNNITTTIEFARTPSAHVMSPEALLRAQQAADFGSSSAERLLPVVRPVNEEAQKAVAKTKKKRSSSKRTRIVVIAEPEGDDYHPSADAAAIADGPLRRDLFGATTATSEGQSLASSSQPGPGVNATFSRTSGNVRETARPSRPWRRGTSMLNLREKGGVLPHQVLIEELLLSAIAPPQSVETDATRTRPSATTSQHGSGGGGSGPGDHCAGGGNHVGGSCGVTPGTCGRNGVAGGGGGGGPSSTTGGGFSGTTIHSAGGGGNSGNTANGHCGEGKSSTSRQNRPHGHSSEPSGVLEDRAVKNRLKNCVDVDESSNLQERNSNEMISTDLLSKYGSEQKNNLTVEHRKQEALIVDDNSSNAQDHIENVPCSILCSPSDQKLRMPAGKTVFKRKQTCGVDTSIKATVNEIISVCAAPTASAATAAAKTTIYFDENSLAAYVDDISTCDNDCDTKLATINTSTNSDCSESFIISDVGIPCSSSDSLSSSSIDGQPRADDTACLAAAAAGQDASHYIGASSQTNATLDDVSRKSDVSYSACVSEETDNASCGGGGSSVDCDDENIVTATTEGSDGSDNSDIAIICEGGDGDSYFSGIDNTVDHEGSDGCSDDEYGAIPATPSSSESCPDIEKTSEHESQHEEKVRVGASSSKELLNSIDLRDNSSSFPSNSSRNRPQKPVDGIPLLGPSRRMCTKVIITERAPSVGFTAPPVRIHYGIPVRTGLEVEATDVEADETGVEAVEGCVEAMTSVVQATRTEVATTGPGVEAKEAEAEPMKAGVETTTAAVEISGAEMKPTGPEFEATRTSRDVCEVSEVGNSTMTSRETSTLGGYAADGDGYSMNTTYSSQPSFCGPNSWGPSPLMKLSISTLSSRVILEEHESTGDTTPTATSYLDPSESGSTLPHEAGRKKVKTMAARISKEKKPARSKSLPLRHPVDYLCQVEGYHTPKLLVTDPENNLKQLERYPATVTILGRVLTQQRQGEEQLSKGPVKIPFTRILSVESVSVHPFRVRILYNDHLPNGELNHETYRLTRENGEELLRHIDSLMADGKVIAKMTSDSVTCGHCDNTYNRCLALSYKDQRNTLCPDCGWTINNQPTKKKHITYDIDPLYYLSNVKYTSNVLPSIKDLRRSRSLKSSDISGDSVINSNQKHGTNASVEYSSDQKVGKAQRLKSTLLPRNGSGAKQTVALPHSSSPSLLPESRALLVDPAAPAATVCRTAYDVISTSKHSHPNPGFSEHAVAILEKRRGFSSASFGASPSNAGQVVIPPASGVGRSYSIVRSKTEDEQLVDFIRQKVFQSKSVSGSGGAGFWRVGSTGAHSVETAKFRKRRNSKRNLRRADAVDHTLNEPSHKLGLKAPSPVTVPINIPSSSTLAKTGLSLASPSFCGSSTSAISSYKGLNVSHSRAKLRNQSLGKRSPGGRRSAVVSPRKAAVSPSSSTLSSEVPKAKSVRDDRRSVRKSVVDGSATKAVLNLKNLKVSSSSPDFASKSSVPPKAKSSKAAQNTVSSSFKMKDRPAPKPLHGSAITTKGSSRITSPRAITKQVGEDCPTTVESLLKRSTQLATSRSLPRNQQSYQR